MRNAAKTALVKYRAVLYAAVAIGLALVPIEKLDSLAEKVTKIAAAAAAIKAATATAPKDHDDDA